MKADIDGAVHIARIASGFGWMWDEPDVTRFCQATGWSILHEDRGHGPSLRTNLDVHMPQCRIEFDRRIMNRRPGGLGAIDRVAIYVADSGQVKPADPQSAAVHRQIRDRLIEELGPVSEYVFGQDLDADYWRRPDVVISVVPHDAFILMELVNPEFQRRRDEDGAYDFNHDDEDDD
ncbi:DUF6301 family protein [Nocardia tengchongensis]|uniref:DUF6301 family protein n=1 Tax=Nocardia tengchongensis TaxID=2055889 RepID=UPI0036505437